MRVRYPRQRPCAPAQPIFFCSAGKRFQCRSRPALFLLAGTERRVFYNTQRPYTGVPPAPLLISTRSRSTAQLRALVCRLHIFCRAQPVRRERTHGKPCTTGHARLLSPQVSSGCRVAVVDARGYLLADSVSDTPFTFANSSDGTGTFFRRRVNESADPAIATAAQYLSLRSGGPSSVWRHFYVGTERYALKAAPLGEGVQWTLAVVVPEADFMANIFASHLLTLFLCGGLVGASALAAIGLVAWLLAPLRDLERQASAMAAGDMDARVEPRGVGAVYGLTRAFALMQAQLQASAASRDETEQQLRLIIRHIPMGVAVFDADGQVRLLNAAGRQLLCVGDDEERLGGMGQLFQVWVGSPVSFCLLGYVLKNCVTLRNFFLLSHRDATSFFPYTPRQ